MEPVLIVCVSSVVVCLSALFVYYKVNRDKSIGEQNYKRLTDMFNGSGEDIVKLVEHSKLVDVKLKDYDQLLADAKEIKTKLSSHTLNNSFAPRNKRS